MGGYITMETLNSINIPKRKKIHIKVIMAKFY